MATYRVLLGDGQTIALNARELASHAVPEDVSGRLTRVSGSSSAHMKSPIEAFKQTNRLGWLSEGEPGDLRLEFSLPDGYVFTHAIVRPAHHQRHHRRRRAPKQIVTYGVTDRGSITETFQIGSTRVDPTTGASTMIS